MLLAIRHTDSPANSPDGTLVSANRSGLNWSTKVRMSLHKEIICGPSRNRAFLPCTSSSNEHSDESATVMGESGFTESFDSCI